MQLHPDLHFRITHRASTSQARAGVLNTLHGAIETPNFIFCATKGAIKGLTMDQMRECGAQIILANTYHLFLSPGGDFLERQGGIHRMADWHGPMLTDSGGFQIFSLGNGWVADEIKGKRQHSNERKLVKITEEGAEFVSYVDGSMHCLTPEISIQTQLQIGADLIVVLDECSPYNVTRDYTARSMAMSHRWETRSLEEYLRRSDGTQGLYGIVQGGVYEDLRRESAEYVSAQPFFGQAIGGCLGGTKEEMEAVVAHAARHLRKDRPTHLLGIGGVDDIWNGIHYGIDTFDCVHPTRVARHGAALVRSGEWGGKSSINLRNACFKNDDRPLDERLPCKASSHFSRAYIHYLLRAGEMLGIQLLTQHNVCFMMELMKSVRTAIREDRIDEERRAWLGR
jgi:queuine tRNA-ribosyltransferase